GLTTALAEIEASLEVQSQRAQQARVRLAEVKKRQPQIAEALQRPIPDDQPQRLTEAQRWALETEARALLDEAEMLDQELLSQPMRVELLGVQRDKATLELNRQLQYIQLLETLVVARRLSDAESARDEAEETERQAFGKHELVQHLAQQNTLLGETLKTLAAELERVTREANADAAEAKRVADNFRLARQKLEIAGLSEALGQVLLEQRRGLPDSGDFEAAEKRRQQLVIDSSLRQIRNQQERARMRDINVYVDDQLASLSETWRGLLRLEILELSELRRDLLDKAIAADDTYLQALGELDFAQRQLSEAVTAYNKFLDERLLWVRTGKPPSRETLQSITQSVGIFLSPSHWLELGRALLLPAPFPWVLLLGLLLFGLLLKFSPVLRTALERSGRNIGQLRHDRYIDTIRALALTLVLALPWPILFTALGLHLQFVQSIDSLDLGAQLSQSASWSGQFVPAVGAAFSGIALYLFYFVAFRIFCERAGLAAVHFGWSRKVTQQLRLETRHLMSVFLPTAFILIASITYDPAALAGGLSRLFFLIVMVSLAWFFGRILAPRQGALEGFYLAHPGNPLTWFRYLWLALGLTLPVMLAVLAIMGYVYTSASFGARLVDTLWLVVAIILIHQLMLRWVLLTERRLEFKDALERRRAQRAMREALEEGDAASGDSAPLSVEEPEIDYGALSEDTKKLITTALVAVGLLGLWAIWSDVLPAFRILNEISLWHYSSLVDGAEKLVPVTLGDAILGLLIIVVGLIAARHLPALMEIVLLARLKITAGSRYAITTLTQYSIVAIGIVLIFSILGGSWSQIQWLVAALGVGIGFGLQEIVANFICGIILLFERPIRIGDVVTVGETSGVVTRIRIRSTTIRNWDQKELVVPNKEFITGRLLNWTLSDPMARIVIPIGIAYGSDVARALQLVQEAAEQHERVLDDPGPLVTFENFGDSALTIMLRCYIESMDYRLLTQSELNQAINHKFEQAGIVIAFPQSDLHLDTSQPLDLRILPAATENT
ncbi:MAG: mechanosensitive ion channel, partial [Gammaproteobacteria bacterium]|nr:mechanosensitive ion channel [Gammaproteobacteria bacterium]